MIKHKLVAAAAALALTVTLLSGCGSSSETSKDNASNEPKMASEQKINHNVGAEPESLDPAKITGRTEGTIINALLEGLTRYDKENKTQPAMAEKWDVSADGKTYTFHIRDAKWSNGDPVTAKDFEYSWLRALDPKTASEYAYQFYYIKNAEAYNTGKIKDASQVAIKATDDKTLVVELNAAAPQFLGLTSFTTYLPVNKKAVEKSPEKWFQDAATFVSNGPFKMTKWTHRQNIELAKFADYWDAKSVKLEKLLFSLIESEETTLTMFETGQIDSAMNPPAQEIERLKGENRAVVTPDLGSYFYRFNTTKKPFNDVRVRKALTMAIDREAIVKNVTKAGEMPATAYVPTGTPDAADPTKDFRKEGGPLFTQFDLEQAKKLLAEAGYPDGKGFPTVSILYNTSEKHAKVAQAVQEMWKKNLGIDVKLTNQEWQVYLDSQDKLAFDVSRSGWSADYMDAMTFMDMFVTNGGNNDTGWSNPEYDKLIKEANSTGDGAKRAEAMHKAEKILMDEMPFMPIYFYVQPYLMNPNIKDAVLPPFGLYGEFKWAWVAE